MTNVASVADESIMGPFGDIHVRRLPASGNNSRPALICLHPAPHDGGFFDSVLPLLNADRTVLAPDYPGYGRSAAPPGPPDISDYARAVIAMIDSLAAVTEPACHLMGFHTGCLVAVETALMLPRLIRRIVLIDVPYFVGSDQQAKYTEAIPTSPPDRKRWGFHAAFTYPCAERFARLSSGVAVIATDGALLDPTRTAAKLLTDCRYRERLDIRRPVFSAQASGIAAEILATLDV